MDSVRQGLLRLYAHYKPEALPGIVRRALDVFGPADTLDQLERREPWPATHGVRLRDIRRAAS